MLCHAGDERAIAATKTYTTSLALIALLAAEWANARDLMDGLRRLPDDIQRTLTLDADEFYSAPPVVTTVRLCLPRGGVRRALSLRILPSICEPRAFADLRKSSRRAS